MASTTPNHALPYPQGSDDATVHTDLQALAEAVDNELDTIAPGQITGPTAGQLLIANASGIITGTTMSGDATITPAGALSITSKKITTTKLDDKAVTTAKLADGAITSDKVGPWIQVASGYANQFSGVGGVTWPTAFPNTSYIVVAIPYYDRQCSLWVTSKAVGSTSFGFYASTAGTGGIYAIGIAL